MVERVPPSPPLLDTLTEQEIGVLRQMREEFPNFDDYTLARFMRARKGVYGKAREMFENYLKWREEFGVENIQDFEFPELEQCREFYQHGFHKTDRLGRPIYIERYGNLNLKSLFELTTVDRMMKYYVKSYESMLDEKYPACAAAAGYPIENSLTILDLGGSASKLMKKKVYKFIKIATGIAQDYYPEILGRMFLVNTPTLFSMVWKVVKGMIDDKTRSKITMEGSKFQKKLFEFVDPDNLPDFLGGNCRCEGGCLNASPGPWRDIPREIYISAPMKRYLDDHPRMLEGPNRQADGSRQSEDNL